MPQLVQKIVHGGTRAESKHHAILHFLSGTLARELFHAFTVCHTASTPF
jgi:hypothetical protein